MLKEFVRKITKVTNEETLDVFKRLIGNKENIIAYIISILVSKVGLDAGVNPFGIAFFGAMANNDIPLLLPLFIIGITTAISFGWVATVKFIISAIAFAGLRAFIKFGDNNTGNAVKVILSTAISEVIGLIISGGLLYDNLLAIYATLTTGIFYLIFSAGLTPVLSLDNKKIFASETLISVGVLLAVAISGIGNLSIFNISLRGIICVLIVLLLGWKRGAAVGAASGIAISIVLGLIGIGNVSTIATYGFCGLLSGVFAKFGKIGATIGFILGNVILAFFANGSTEVIVSIKEIIVASVVLFLIPKKAAVVIDNLFDYDKSLEESRTYGYFPETTIYRLNAVSEVVDDIANRAGNDNSEYNDELGMFIQTLNNNTCKRCPNYEKCWNKNYHSMYETVFNCVEILQTNSEIMKQEIDSAICINKELFADGLNFSYQMYKVNHNWQQKMREKRSQMSKQLKGVSKVINMIKEEAKANVVEKITPNGKYTLEIGMAKTKKNSSKVSGDNTIMVKLKDGKYMFGVSDGMGSGEEANNNSRQVINMLEKLLNTGFEKEDAIELVNSVISFNDDEKFATLDVSMFDTVTGDTEFIKVSACPTYIKKKSGVDIVQSVSLPVGILENADIDLYDKVLEDGDIIVMVTDGVLEASKNENEKGRWILDLLKAINTDQPQRLADIILQEAIDSNYGVVEDDMTIIIAKVKS